ncbi:mandelate racemase/muconate lactonizing enzyme family protein [Sporosarcina siberiensis]|uniref:Mandelate racemase/muconate lactonizing enzyme family protein n=1 Tax=Sporosarcina siberiensis TaxID=1365606 RepID=A0ABW4SI20_9BACL
MLSKIVKVNTYIIEVPLQNEWKISLYAANTRRHAITEVITSDGIRGYGEASPSPAFMGETADTVKLVNDLYLGPAVLGKGVNELSIIHEQMNAVIHGHSAAKSAVDIAIHDAWGKTLNQPVYELIGGKYRDEIPLAYVVGIKDDQSAYDEAMQKIEEGFSVIKVKVGREPKRDVHLVQLIRKAISDSKKEVKIRLDANQGYNVPDAIRVIRELETTGELESVEQPVKKSDLKGLRDIRRAVDTPIMIDETVFGLEEALFAIQYECADIINLKICKVGGIHQSKKIAAIAEAAGITCAIGSNLELGIGIAASMHVAASTPVISRHNDFICGAYLHTHDLTTVPAKDLVSDGKMKVVNGPGLGIEFNMDLISK